MEILKIIIKIIYNILFAILLLSASFILLTTYNIIPGYNFYVVMSGSMEPTIHTGSIVGTKEETEYNIEDVITAKMKNNQTETYTHRVIEKQTQEEETIFKTKGDANESEDPDTITQDQILGKVFFTIPLIGYPIHFAKQPTGFLVMIILPSVIIAASEINVIKEEVTKFLKERKVKSEEDDDETED